MEDLPDSLFRFTNVLVQEFRACNKVKNKEYRGVVRRCWDKEKTRQDKEERRKKKKWKKKKRQHPTHLSR